MENNKQYNDYQDYHMEGTCPVCGCSDIDYTDMKPADSGVYYPAKCNNCKTTFNEHYDLFFAGHWCIKTPKQQYKLTDKGKCLYESFTEDCKQLIVKSVEHNHLDNLWVPSVEDVESSLIVKDKGCVITFGIGSYGIDFALNYPKHYIEVKENGNI